MRLLPQRDTSSGPASLPEAILVSCLIFLGLLLGLASCGDASRGGGSTGGATSTGGAGVAGSTGAGVGGGGAGVGNGPGGTIGSGGSGTGGRTNGTAGSGGGEMETGGRGGDVAGGGGAAAMAGRGGAGGRTPNGGMVGTGGLGGTAGASGRGGSDTATIVPDPSWTCSMPEGIPPPTAGTLVFSVALTVGATHDVGNTQFGHRRQLDISGGSITGDKLKGTVLSGGLEYELTLSTGATELEDVLIWKTSDNVTIFTRICGVAAAGDNERNLAH